MHSVRALCEDKANFNTTVQVAGQTVCHTVGSLAFDPVNWLFKVCSTSFVGEPMVATAAGIWDNYNVKKQLLHSW